jgi:hypothetical protein
MRPIYLVGMIATCGVCIFGCVACDDHGDQPRSARSIHWDMSDRHNKEVVQWPRDAVGDSFDFGEAKVRISLSQANVFEDFAAHVYCQTDREQVREITVDMPPQSLSNVCAHAQSLIRDWGMAGQDFEQWRSQATTGDLTTYNTRVKGDAKPGVSISIAPAVGDDEKPWHLMFSIYWGDEKK